MERDDFASGTSSKSTKLIHGGVRYLEKAFKNQDYGIFLPLIELLFLIVADQFLLVKEALEERFIFLKNAPHLTHQIPIMIPVHKYWQLPYFWLGMKVYDLISTMGGGGIESSYYLSRSKSLAEFPMLNEDDLVGAIVYYDGLLRKIPLVFSYPKGSKMIHVRTLRSHVPQQSMVPLLLITFQWKSSSKKRI